VKICITGATGFIGRNLVNRLGKNGSVLKLLYHNQKPDFPENDRTEYVAGGLEDSESLTELCKETEVLIHLIGIIVETRHKKFQTTVVQGTKEVVQAERSRRDGSRSKAISVRQSRAFSRTRDFARSSLEDNSLFSVQ